MNPIYASRRRNNIIVKFLCLGAAAVVPERQDRRAPPADAELQAVVTTELVREEVGAIGLHLPRLPHRLVAAHERTAVVVGRAVVQELRVPEGSG